MPENEIVVLGAGIVGLAAALAYADRGHQIALVDAGELDDQAIKESARVYALNQASIELLEHIKTWQALPKQALSPYRQMQVWDGVSGARLEFDCRMQALSELGVIVEESILRKQLLAQAIAHPRIDLYPFFRVEGLKHYAGGIELRAGDTCLQGSLLLVADGANSAMRELLQVGLVSWPYQQEALVATVAVEKPHQQTAWQIFNPQGPLAFLPLQDEYQCSIVWSTTPEEAASLKAMAEPEFNQALTRAFQGQLGGVEVQGRRYSFPLVMRHVKQYAGPGWALLGDAAHTIHPLAGLGLNLGLADLTCLLSCLKNPKDGLSPRTLAPYQRQRKAEVWQVIALMEGLKRLFSNDFAPVVGLRSLGVNLFNRILPIKQLFIQQASGVPTHAIKRPAS